MQWENGGVEPRLAVCGHWWLVCGALPGATRWCEWQVRELREAGALDGVRPQALEKGVCLHSAFLPVAPLRAVSELCLTGPPCRCWSSQPTIL